MKIGFSASRYGATPEQQNSFTRLMAELTESITETHYGDCVGGDEELLMLLVQLGVGGVLHSRPGTVSTRWDMQWRANTARRYPELGIIQHPPKHPLIRNRHIVDSVDRLYACPETSDRNAQSGTWSTIRYALGVGKPAIVIHTNGVVELLTTPREKEPS